MVSFSTQNSLENRNYWLLNSCTMAAVLDNFQHNKGSTEELWHYVHLQKNIGRNKWLLQTNPSSRESSKFDNNCIHKTKLLNKFNNKWLLQTNPGTRECSKVDNILINSTQVGKKLDNKWLLQTNPCSRECSKVDSIWIHRTPVSNKLDNKWLTTGNLLFLNKYHHGNQDDLM